MGNLTLDPTHKQPIGAVMVVGGGIAGMQASLDLAEQGFKVYLVEAKSAIGGHMAQLDKTFPTNDCAMCTISPKLVETGRHLNIEILTNTEVLGVEGEAGNFTARLCRKPRYIDPLKCVGCGDCEKVCPIVLPDEFNEGLSTRRAAYRLYPQAIPAAYAIEKKGIAPCRDACPAGQRAQGYIALIREGRYADALRVIKEDNPFPGICGRICNHRCELACNRNLVDEPLNIHALKRFVADWDRETSKREPVQRLPQTRPQRVAVIGAGPCGLTAAKDLVSLGYGVTVFEALPVAGGMLRVGVPEYRLPSAIVDREVQDIIALGVDLRLNTTVDNIDDLLGDHKGRPYNAVLIAVGAHEGKKLPIPGADLPDVLVNTKFLRDVRLAELQTSSLKSQTSNGGDSEFEVGSLKLGVAAQVAGKRILVLGGGNVAIDCARTAVRLGAASVAMACLESREKMPSHPWEIEEAEAEGVTIYPARSFKRILESDGGRVTGVECVNVAFMEFDSEGKLTLETEPNSEHILPCDAVIFSIGQRAGLAFIPADAGVGITRQATIAVNPNTFAATRPGVFAAGDATTGTAFVIEAVAAGHKVATTIYRYLSGEPLEPKFAPDLPVVKMTRPEVEEKLVRSEIRVTPRVPMPMIPVADRVGANLRIRPFAEIEQGYTEEQAQAEASRCLACGICSECLSCVYVCGVKAINHDEVERIEEVKVGAVILAPGYQAYNAKLSPEFGFGRFANVVTALQFERLLSASGPTAGHVKRPSDGARPKKIAFLQCIGSRDQAHDYCSAVCCMYAAKEAIMAKEHEPDTEVHIFMMDMRAFSKGYEEYYRRAQDKYGVHYHRCRISALQEDPATRNLVLRYTDSEQLAVNSEQPTVHCSLFTDHFDLVVLSVGMEMSPAVRKLGRDLGVELDPYGFCATTQFDPLQTSRPGIYAVGPFREPKDIPETVVDASGAAAQAAALLAPARGLLAREREYPPERDVSGEEPRIGVFVCHCGSNIGGFLDVPAVTEYAKTLPSVVHAEHMLYTCSQDSIAKITGRAKELGLNRVVVASCTPRTHEPLFQDSIRAAGLNPYLFEMANIRNHCSWVHSKDWAAATAKAKDLVRMSVARVAALEPLHTLPVSIERSALVIGGGVAGMAAALSLAEQGFPAHLVERDSELGGNLRNVFYLADTASKQLSVNSEQSEPQAFLREMVGRIQANPLITVHCNTELLDTTGFVGNFTSRLSDGAEIRHGVTLVATGGKEYHGPEYEFGKDPRIITQQQFEALLADGGWQVADGNEQSAIGYQPSATRSGHLRSVVMIQCVGPAEKYCGRTCCATAFKNALRLKELNPKAEVTILYRDIRAYGFKERLYTEARRAGVRFIRYDFDRKPIVEIPTSNPSTSLRTSLQPPRKASNLQSFDFAQDKSPISVRVREPILGRDIELHPDLLVLSTPLVPADGARELGSKLKVPVDADGWFLEAHVKLRPVDFASEGLFVAGAAHYPKLLDETIVQARAAASRAATILARKSLTAGGAVAVVAPEKCTGCLTCVRICPYHVPKITADFTGAGGIVGAAHIEPTICQGCGLCASECPAKAISLMHYRDAQVMAKVEALFEEALA